MKKTAPLEAIKLECQNCMQVTRPVPCPNTGCPLYRYRFGVDQDPDAGKFEPTLAIADFCVDCVGGPDCAADIKDCNGRIIGTGVCPMHQHRLRRIPTKKSD